MLSKIILDYLVKEVTLEELKAFNEKVLIPQGAKNLSEHFIAAQNVLLQQKTKKNIKLLKDDESIPIE